VTGSSERTRSVSTHACSRCPCSRSTGTARCPAAAGVIRSTTASPSRVTSEPSALLIARLAVAVITRPCGLVERMSTWSISSVSVSG